MPGCENTDIGEPIPGVRIDSIDSISDHLYRSNDRSIARDLEIGKQFGKGVTLDEID